MQVFFVRFITKVAERRVTHALKENWVTDCIVTMKKGVRQCNQITKL